jgi:TATA-box binding protein (TBP) (component of TFIID and TFIIIB)
MTTSILQNNEVKTVDSKNAKCPNVIELDGLPDDLSISTMTITCYMNTQMDVCNIGRYIELSPGNIISVKQGDSHNVRSIVKPKKKNAKKPKKKQRSFFNQATVVIESKNKKHINVKLFKNGAIQMTGCKSLDNCVDVLKILCQELKKSKAVFDAKENKIIKKPFITQPEKVEMSQIFNFQIRMINSNFHIGFLVDRQMLYELLKELNIDCSYEPLTHACVNIKYNYKNKDIISIFVFESGSIIITGAKNKDHIVDAYKFVTKMLYENYDIIVKNDIDKFLERPDIQKIIKESKENLVENV